MQFATTAGTPAILARIAYSKNENAAYNFTARHLGSRRPCRAGRAMNRPKHPPVPRAEQAYLALREAIIEQALVPGMKLQEDVIGAHFGVSRTLARAALGKLHAEGLVDIRPKRSATVAHPTFEEAKDVFAVRHTLERQVVPLVMARWSTAIETDLNAHLALEEAAVAKGNPVSIRLAGEFHIKLAEHSGNHLLHRYVTELVSRCSLILALYGRAHSSECAVHEHRELIRALGQDDRAQAEALMDHHLGAVEERALRMGTVIEPLSLEQILSRRFPLE
jgi:DNA-binding GntR family transcriptional regulator